jgi:hypothetical protein
MSMLVTSPVTSIVPLWCIRADSLRVTAHGETELGFGLLPDRAEQLMVITFT